MGNLSVLFSLIESTASSDLIKVLKEDGWFVDFVDSDKKITRVNSNSVAIRVYKSFINQDINLVNKIAKGLDKLKFERTKGFDKAAEDYSLSNKSNEYWVYSVNNIRLHVLLGFDIIDKQKKQIIDALITSR